jgi:hypothetical protein
VGPLTDSLAVSAAAAGGFDYGRIRLWGSLTYVLPPPWAGSPSRIMAPAHHVAHRAGWVMTVGAAFLLPRCRGAGPARQA